MFLQIANKVVSIGALHCTHPHSVVNKVVPKVNIHSQSTCLLECESVFSSDKSAKLAHRNSLLVIKEISYVANVHVTV